MDITSNQQRIKFTLMPIFESILGTIYTQDLFVQKYNPLSAKSFANGKICDIFDTLSRYFEGLCEDELLRINAHEKFHDLPQVHLKDFKYKA